MTYSLWRASQCWGHADLDEGTGDPKQLLGWFIPIPASVPVVRPISQLCVRQHPDAPVFQHELPRADEWKPSPRTRQPMFSEPERSPVRSDELLEVRDAMGRPVQTDTIILMESPKDVSAAAPVAEWLLMVTLAEGNGSAT